MKKANLKYIWIIIILFSLLIVLIAAFPQNRAHELFLRYLSILSSWPIVILFLVLVFLFMFKESISELIIKLKVRTPQGYEFGSQLQMEAKPLDKTAIEEIKSKYEAEKKVISDFSWMIIEFEKMIRVLFMSQFMILKHLSASKINKVDVPKTFIEENYYKNIYLREGGNPIYIFENYLNYLKTTGTIVEEPANNILILRITLRGEIFLRYCAISNYTENIFIPR